MPEFVLQGADAPEFSALDSFTQGYIEALFFTEEERLCEESGRAMPDVAIDTATMESRFVGGDSPGFADLAPDALERIKADCEAFKATPAWLAFTEWRDNDDSEDTSPADDEQAGRDFWYTRNGHGVGFWDRPASYYGPHQEALDKTCGHGTAFGSADAYVGDDGKVHLS